MKIPLLQLVGSNSHAKKVFWKVSDFNLIMQGPLNHRNQFKLTVTASHTQSCSKPRMKKMEEETQPSPENVCISFMQFKL